MRWPVARDPVPPDRDSCPLCGAHVIGVEAERVEIPLIGSAQTAYIPGQILYVCAKSHKFRPNFVLIPVEPYVPWRGYA